MLNHVFMCPIPFITLATRKKLFNCMCMPNCTIKFFFVGRSEKKMAKDIRVLRNIDNLVKFDDTEDWWLYEEKLEQYFWLTV